MFEAHAQTIEPAPTADEPDTLAEAVQADPGVILDKIAAWVEGFQRLLPNIAVALVVLLVFVGLGWGVQNALVRWGKRRDRENLGAVLGSFVKWAVIVLGGLVALIVVIPTFNPGDLIAGLGIGSIAIGFAFKDILQNWLAGLLLLIRRPFRIGDEIVVNGYEGRVEWIETRATMIRTYDGRRAIIPNADVFTNAVTVNTAFDLRRSEVDVGIGYGDPIPAAREAILAALREVEGVEPDPAPEVLAWELAGSSVNLKVRWWSHSRRTDVVHVQARVVEAIKGALDRAGIDMPFPTQVVLHHDQTEEVDGVRGRQREGWPPRQDGPQPRPARDMAFPRDGAQGDG
ncbi:mechanosensitive ion channel family protein [Rubellimicrobium aerolatum]|uniref:Small-conductance mechanosensitive channel n=1 Tax=Rubellimicrobium aerolatum TaxID=490979 RepID=A0ABW0SHA6_9RHOB|nr:mechanosensitive ion channel family protein [Rubellimicrobium aerolatum]MBP1807643.1 small-conductance mechanosensitive channel [Rubellimicrobium aerolatum]